ncbi:hypothetical protein [Actinoplanes sp. HUAS TT8]|uniref:hypothetical protein n=1 Tax=Actinoplanes sp. HUAS TT8 TaxID=3447453 RepID=UPI003F524B33
MTSPGTGEVAGERAGWAAGVVVVVVVGALYFQSRTDVFLDPRNLRNMAITAVSFGLLTVGQTLLLRMRYIDPSAASIAGLTGAGTAVLVSTHHWPLGAAVIAAILAGAVVGGFNGVLAGTVGGARFPALLGTLGVLGLAELLRYYILGDQVVPVTDRQLRWWIGTPEIVVLALILLAFALALANPGVAASLDRAGRSHDSGDTGARHTKLLGFVIVGVLAALAGLADIGRAQAAGPWPTTSLGLAAIVAAIAGGASVRGGRGGALTVVCGIVLVEALTNGLLLSAAAAAQVTLAVTALGAVALSLDVLIRRPAPI